MVHKAEVPQEKKQRPFPLANKRGRVSLKLQRQMYATQKWIHWIWSTYLSLITDKWHEMQNHRTDHRALQTGCGCTFLSVHHPPPRCPSRFQCVLISVLSQACCVALQLSSGFLFFFFLRKCSRNLWPDTSLHLNHKDRVGGDPRLACRYKQPGRKGKVCAGSKLQRERKRNPTPSAC